MVMHHHRETHETAVSAYPFVQPGIVFQLAPVNSMTVLPPSGTATQNDVETHESDTN
jgi:hypothetical protein